MSSPHSAAAAAAVATALNNDPATAAADGPPPAARLHRHALESVFAFLSQRELALALGMSRDWLAAVQTMRRLELVVRQPRAPLAVLVQSVMGRHVGELESVDLDAAGLSVLADGMGHLRALRCALQLAPSQPLTFPAKLRQLKIELLDPAHVADINAAVATISQLQLLEDFTIQLPAMDPLISFAPLAALPLLRQLEMCVPSGEGEFSNTQIDQLRALPRLLKVEADITPPLLQRLLRQPHGLQWRQIPLPAPLDDESADLLPQIPSLTKLARWTLSERFDWLRGLPNLTDVSLRFVGQDGSAGRVASLISGLQHCTNVETLALHQCRDLTAAQLALLLPRLPRLQELRLSSLNIDSLAFLSQSPLTSRLSILHLSDCRRLPLSDLRHVQALCVLKTLALYSSFTAPLDETSRSLYRPPSAALPLLEEFEYSAPTW